MSLSPVDMDFLGRLVSTHTGVTIDPDSATLAELRLDTIARKQGLEKAASLLARLRSGPPNGLERQVVEALLNNETSFFRDLSPFDALRDFILPAALRRAGAGEAVTVWSAACSTGQEPFSVALLASDALPAALPRLRLIASDFSLEALIRARKGVYSQIEVNRGLPAPLLVKYFSKVGPDWRLRDAVRTMVDFRDINLLGGLDVPLCDVILLRNVLIYLPLEHRRAILDRVRSRLKPDGILLLGMSETTLGVDDEFDAVPMGPVTAYKARGGTRRRGPVTLGDADVEEVVRGVWSLTLGLVPVANKEAVPAAPVVAATIRLSGAWTGRVTMRCSAALARRAAAAMFRRPAERLTAADLEDAVGELANMTAGNLRSFLPGPTGLSLPRAEDAPGDVPLCRTSFVCEGGAFEIGVGA